MSCSVVDRRSAVGRSTGACRLQGGSSGSLAVKSPPGSGPNAGLGAAVTTGRNPAQFRPNKPCCFCWCCCCSCSCLVKGVEDNGPTKNPNNTDLFNCDGEPTPTLEEIRNWGKSFDKLMKSTAGRKVFRDFLRCEYSEENILFWLACEELKRESNPDAVEERARFIYEDYISILSPKEVSLDSRVREIVNRNMVEPTPHTFDEAQLQIYTLMHRDSYPRFVNSPLYKTLAQLNNDEDAVEQQRTEQTPPPQQHASPQLTVVTPTTPQTTAPQLASPQLVCKVSEASPPPHEVTTGAVPSSVTEQTSLPTSCTPMPSPIAVPSLSVANQTSEQTQCDSGNIG